MTRHPTGNTVDAATHYELKAFYADHMARCDHGELEGWLEAFDDDATMSTNVWADSLFISKATLAPKMRNLDGSCTAAGTQRRHVATCWPEPRRVGRCCPARCCVTIWRHCQPRTTTLSGPFWRESHP